MAIISVRIPLDECLLCDARKAEVSDPVDLYLDPVKYPAPPVNPIRGTVILVETPGAGDPEDAESVITVEFSDADLPVGVSLLEPCDIDKVRCADCCVRNEERLDLLEGNRVQFMDGGVPPLTVPSDQNEDFSDTIVTVLEVSGEYYIYFPDLSTWRLISRWTTWPANLGAPPSPVIGDIYIMSTAGSFDSETWNIDDIGYYDGANWLKIGLGGSGVQIIGAQSIAGVKTFTDEPIFSAGLTSSAASSFTHIDTATVTATGLVSAAALSASNSVDGNTLESTITTTVGTNLIVGGDIDHNGAGLGLFGVAPAAQSAHIADPSGGATIDAEARTAIDAILVVLESYGLTAAV